MLSTWKSLLKIGCSEDLPLRTKNRIMMINCLTAYFLFITLLITVLYSLFQLPGWYTWLLGIPLYGVVFGLHKKKKFNLARMIFYWGTVGLLAVWSLLNRGSGVVIGFLTMGIVSVFIFEGTKGIIFGGVVTMIAFVLFKTIDIVYPFVPTPSFQYQTIQMAISGSVYIMVFLGVMIQRSMIRHYYRKFITEYRLLQETLVAKERTDEELRSTNESLRSSNDALHHLTTQLDWIVRQKSLELQSYMDAINVHIYSAITNPSGVIVKVNEPLIRVTGYSREELIGNTFRIINSGYHPKEFYRNLYSTISAGKIWRAETRNKAKDGSIFWIDQVILPVRNENKEIVYYLMLALPITERKEMEFQRAKTMELLESIAHRTSHNVRGPLARLMGLTNLLDADMIGLDEVRSVANRLKQSVKELDLATRELTTFVNNHQKVVNGIKIS